MENYPLGSNNESAPWNQLEPDPIEFNVTTSQTLSKSIKVDSKNYYLEWNYLDKEDGFIQEVLTDNIDFIKEYKEQHYTIQELLKEFRKLIKEAIQSIDNNVDLVKIFSDPIKTSKLADRIKYLSNLDKECDGWIEDEIEVIEN